MEILKEEQKIVHCAAALWTADIIFEIAEKSKGLSLKNCRDGSDMSDWQQTSEGLLLEFWGSRPVSVVTPWGMYNFFGWYEYTLAEKRERKIWQQLFPRMKSTLGLGIFKRKTEIDVDEIHGDLWAIGVQPSELASKFTLPFPQERGYSSYLSFESAMEEWSRLRLLVCRVASVVG